jgi:hypothetical protein
VACDRIQAPLVGPPLSAAALAGPGLVPAERHVRSWVGSRFGLEGEYLLHVAEMLRAHWAWRSFLLEQRALIAQLPAREARRARRTAAVPGSPGSSVSSAFQPSSAFFSSPARALMSIPRSTSTSGPRITIPNIRPRSTSSE